MEAHDKALVETLAEQLWWTGFKRFHAKEMHLYDKETMPDFKRMKRQRKDHYRKKAKELLSMLDEIGLKVEEK